MKTIKNKIVYEKNINNIDGKVAAVVFPDSVDELLTIVRMTDPNMDIIPRGNGTSLTGAVIPENSVIVDFSKLNRILEVNTSKRVVIVEPGVILDDLNEQLEQYGLEFPIIPLFGGVETVGGMIAKNSSGSREIKYNRMMNWIDYIEVINSRGEKVKVSKSDLSDFAGMEGTTGLIIKAALRLTQKKQRSLTILKISNLEEVFAVSKRIKFSQDICSIDILSKSISSLLGFENKYHLFIEFESDEGNFKADSYAKFMKLKSQAYKKAAVEGFCYMSNAKFLIDSMQDFLIYLESSSIPFFGHISSGVVYPLFKADQMQKNQETMNFAKKLRARVAYSFGAGLTKKDSLEISEKNLISKVKTRLDPKCRFNKNKLLDYQPKISMIQESKEAEEPEEKQEESEEKIKSKKKEEPIQKKLDELEVKKEAEEKEAPSAPIAELSGQTALRRKEQELSPEEREKIKKIASGFFSGGKTESKTKEEENKTP